MRLIDAKELERQIKEAFQNSNPVLMGQMLRWIRKQTTIDAVPVVRCKDCKHFDTRYMECQCPYVSTDNEGGASYSLGFGTDDFCSYGERR